MDLNIRNIPEELIRELKRKALDEGKTLREHCIELLSQNRTPRRIIGMVTTGRAVQTEIRDLTRERDEYSQG